MSVRPLPRGAFIGPAGTPTRAFLAWLEENRTVTNEQTDDKADKVSGATAGHFAGLNSSGDLTDSGRAPTDYSLTSHAHAGTYAAYSSKIKFTPLGGVAVSLVNKSGGTLAAGTLVQADATTDNAVTTCGASGNMCLGAALEDIADGAAGWIVVAGVADVLLQDATAATHGNWVYTSTTAGRANATSATLIAASHLQGIGKCLESQGAGTDVLCTILLQKN